MRRTKKLFDIPDYNGPGVYAIKNITRGKVYIGSSIHVRDRLRAHECSFRHWKCNKKICEDLEKGDVFEATILERIDEEAGERGLRSAESTHINATPKGILYNDDKHPPYAMLSSISLGVQSDIPCYVNRRKPERKPKEFEVKLKIGLEQRDVIQTHAQAQGESVNGFIKRAIQEAIQRDQQTAGE